MRGIAQTRARGPLVMIVVMGFLAISLLHLLLTIATSQAVYELSDLKREKRELDTTSQILAEEVASLSSQQNLLNTASKLGMVANSNPVFLRLDDQKVLGKPKPALGSSSQSRNLVANSSMIKEAPAKQKAAPASMEQPQPLSEVSEVSFVSAIPASPTR
jgi:Na+-transporting NADH:ubiquinone oxidoreductase subunit NqrC